MNAMFGFASRLATRFIFDNKTQSMLILSGIVVGVAVMVFLIAIIDSLQANIIDKTVGRSPHLTITLEENASSLARTSYNELPVMYADLASRSRRPISNWNELCTSLRSDPRITFVMPAVDGPALIKSGKQEHAVLIRGFDLAEADRIYSVSPSLVSGEARLNSSEILIGTDLSTDLGVKTGEQVQLELPGGQSMLFMIAGVYDLKVQSINENWVIMEKTRAASLLDLNNQASSIEVRVTDIFTAQNIGQEWQSRMPDYRFVSWQEKNEQLLSGLRSQSSSSITIQFFVLLSLTLGIASVLAISAVQKYKQIGILKAIGVQSRVIGRAFILQSLYLSFLGAILGALAGIGMTRAFVALTTQPGGEALFNLTIDTWSIARIVMITMLFAALAAYIPARRAAGLNPIEVIRNN